MARILYAEDSADDALLMSMAFRRAQISHVLLTVSDGGEAINYLSDNPRPDLVLLDIKMPKLDGFDVLACIRSRPELKDLPVIILTASDLPEDRDLAKKLGVRDYFVKSPEWDALATALNSRFDAILTEN